MRTHFIEHSSDLGDYARGCNPEGIGVSKPTTATVPDVFSEMLRGWEKVIPGPFHILVVCRDYNDPNLDTNNAICSGAGCTRSA